MINGSFEVASLRRRRTAMGRQRPFAAGGSSRWLDLVAESPTRLRAPPTPNVKFRDTADSRTKNWPAPGIGDRRHSSAKSERQHPVFGGRSICPRERQHLAGNVSLRADYERRQTAALPAFKRIPLSHLLRVAPLCGHALDRLHVQ